MNIGAPEILILALLILLLFGASKLPNLARSVGRSARIFKSEMNEMKNENAAHKSAAEEDTYRPAPRSLEQGQPHQAYQPNPAHEVQRDLDQR